MSVAPAPSPEIIPRALVQKEQLRVAKALSHEQQAAKDLLAKAKKDTWRQGLGEKTRSDEQYAAKTQRKLSQFGLDSDDQGQKNLNTDEQQRFDAASRESRIDKEYVEHGYDGIKDLQVRQALQGKVTRVILNNRQLAQEYKALPSDEARKDFTESILRDGRMRAAAQAQFKQVLDREPLKNLDSIQQASDANSNLEEARALRENQRATVEDKRRQLDVNSGQLSVCR